MTEPIGDPPPGPDAGPIEWWACTACRSINRAEATRCYSCGLARLGTDEGVPRRSHRVAFIGVAVGLSAVLTGALLWSAGRPTPTTAPSLPAVSDTTPGRSSLPAIALSPSPSRSPASSGSGYVVGQPVAVADVETHTVLRAEAWPGRDPAPVGERYLAVEVSIQANPGQTPKFDQSDYSVLSGADTYRNALLLGRNPQLGSGTIANGGAIRAWVSFRVPKTGPYMLLYEFPLGYNGELVRTAILLDPISKPTPEPKPATPSGPRPGPSTPNWGYPNVIASTYFSGYGLTSPTARPVTFVAGSWAQPRVTCDGSSQRRAVSVWVGIEDGAGNDLQQLGTAGDCEPGSRVPVYYAWYEMFPEASVPIALAVRPGDRFTASVQRHGNTWTLKIADTTTGAKFSIEKTRRTPGTVALWIVEAPSTQASEVGFHVLPLAKYATVTMTSCKVVVASVHGTIGTTSLAHFRFDMRTTTGIPKAFTGDMQSRGTRFISSWRHQ